MPQSLSNLLVHLVFSTKGRLNFILPDVKEDLYAYMRGIGRELKAPVIEIGGMEDHVHVLFTLPRTLNLSEVVQNLKAGSSRFIKEKKPALARDFAWQRGYGAFSTAPSTLDRVVQYIRRQEEHHSIQTFQDEYRALLIKHGLVFDKTYVWD